jgi:hypothetical protein
MKTKLTPEINIDDINFITPTQIPNITDIDQCNIIIELQNMALRFYANKDNYPSAESSKPLASILIDKGELAAHTLNAAENLLKQYDIMVAEYENDVDNNYFSDEINLIRNQ